MNSEWQYAYGILKGKHEANRNINNGLESVGGWTSTEPPNVSIDPTSKRYRDAPPTLPTYPSKVRAYTPAKIRATFGIAPRGMRDPISTSSTITAQFENMMTEATKFFTRRSKYVRFHYYYDFVFFRRFSCLSLDSCLLCFIGYYLLHSLKHALNNQINLQGNRQYVYFHQIKQRNDNT